MYKVDKTPWGKYLTETEILNERISARKLRTLLQMRCCSVKQIGRGENSFGEFLFISTQIGKTGMEFYGCGQFDRITHNWLVEEFKMFMNTTHDTKGLKKSMVLETFDSELEKAGKWRDECKRSEKSPQDDLIGDLEDVCGDPDAFQAELEDNPELADLLGVEI